MFAYWLKTKARCDFLSQLYGRRAAWEDPAAWVIDTYPWASSPPPGEWPPLLQLRPEDVGFDGYSAPREGARKELPQSDSDADPLVSKTTPPPS